MKPRLGLAHHHALLILQGKVSPPAEPPVRVGGNILLPCNGKNCKVTGHGCSEGEEAGPMGERQAGNRSWGSLPECGFAGSAPSPCSPISSLALSFCSHWIVNSSRAGLSDFLLLSGLLRWHHTAQWFRQSTDVCCESCSARSSARRGPHSVIPSII